MARSLSYAHDRLLRPPWQWPAPGMARQVRRWHGVLDPLERSSEVLFGLIMVLAYTASIRVAGGGEDVRAILVGAIGCNFAWAIVDAAMYLMRTFVERSRGLMVLRAIRQSRDDRDQHRLIREVIPPALARMLGSEEFEALRRRMAGRVEPSTRLRAEDYAAAAWVFLLVFLSTFPVVLPFFFMTDVRLALRVAQGIAMAMLFTAGWQLGSHAGRPPWRTGLAMATVGLLFGAFTYSLGG